MRAEPRPHRDTAELRRHPTFHRKQPRGEPRTLALREGAVYATPSALRSIGATLSSSRRLPRSLAAKHTRIRGEAKLVRHPVSAELRGSSAAISKVWQHLRALAVARRSDAVPDAWRTADPDGVAEAIAHHTMIIFARDVGVDVSLGAAPTWRGLRGTEACWLGDAARNVVAGRPPALADTLEVFSAIGGQRAAITAHDTFRFLHVTPLRHFGLGRWADGARLLRHSPSDHLAVSQCAGIIHRIVAGRRAHRIRPRATRAAQRDDIRHSPSAHGLLISSGS
jgi:hypothetical protein